MDIEALHAAVDERRRQDVHDTWGYHSRVVASHRVLGVAPPKNACTATKRLLLALEDPSWCGVSPDSVAGVHDLGARLAEFDTAEVCRMLTSPEWFRFAVVRNPYDRLFSAYKSKIGNTWDRQYIWLRNDIRAAFDYPADPDGKLVLVSFADYVRYVTGTDDPRVRLDGHIDQQVNILAADVIPYDEIGRFEAYPADMARMLERIAAPAAVRSLVDQKLNPTAHLPLPAVYDQELAGLTYRMYEADFDAFGYARDSWRFA